MSEELHMSVVQHRLALALVIVAALIAAVPLSSVFASEASVSDAADSLPVGIRAQELAQANTIDDALSQIEVIAHEDGEDAVPAWFQHEIGFMSSARDVRTDGVSVVGYLVDDAHDKVLPVLTSHMEARGWIAVPLGDVEGATFVKQSGACTWALATCTQVGLATSIVFRCNVG